MDSGKQQDKDWLFSEIYQQCRKSVPGDKWLKLVSSAGSIESFPDTIIEETSELDLREYLGELARLELAVHNLKKDNSQLAQYTEKLTLNPTIRLFENTWKNLASFIEGTDSVPGPVKGEEAVILWCHPVTGAVRAKPAADKDLLVMKMALEELPGRAVALEGNIHLAAVEAAVIEALEEGLVTGPEPRIRRNFRPERDKGIDSSFFASRIFTLQWHITQACDLHCRHCYDRSQYKPLSLQQEIAVLDDLAEFCSSHNVHGQVTFTGGNPLLHPDFETLYREAAGRGFTLAILGNPASREQIERLNAIQPLAFYQVSLEGLEEHNDYMRGKGHFKRVMNFLDLLQELNVYSMVMLTLTGSNLDQVLPLAEMLRKRTDLFTFNRLSLTGEGAKLIAIDPETFPTFLRDYAAAVESNPCLGIKDNLLNIIYHEQKKPLFGGCTGYGCGAAFNFMAVLADGAVHACRKFPSYLGNLTKKSLSDIYDSAAAKQYRQGAQECSSCRLNAVCRGCLAVSYSHGLDVFTAKDPHCFFQAKK
ncbi:MAG: selenobiotic family peptide radical SAM maturase [Deltaproteobacteria bacterium]|jgi:selenobiotic family peptide radical SAM maturase|nr:selenobiotic family peptide radical SAM maturase [Deltaproteobacteria bacterium]